MRKIAVGVLAGIIVCFGCARVRVEGTKDPIKVDITMRLDVYQHVQKDIDDIENVVSGGVPAAKTAGQQSFLSRFITLSYAEDSLDPEVEAAALRRKDRRAELASWQEKGIAGENNIGLVEIRQRGTETAAVEELAAAENKDRMIIYQAVAEKNGTGVEDVQSLYARRLQSDAPPGTPVEMSDGSWKIK